MSKGKRLLRFTVFALLCTVMLLVVSWALQRKTVLGAWDYMNQQYAYRNEPKNSIDVLAFGSSHMYCTLNPQTLYEASGLTSYVLATQQQPIEATICYIRQALKTQQPKWIILETYMADTQSTGDYEATAAVLHDAIDSMPWSAGKLELIRRLVPANEQKNYLFPFIAYHSRWEGLTQADYQYRYLFNAEDSERGYVKLAEAKPQTPFEVPVYPAAPSGLSAKTYQAIEEIRLLAKEHNAQLLLLFAPYSSAAENADKLASVRAYAEEKGIAFLDMNMLTDSIGFDFETDFYDTAHLNSQGSNKATAFLAQILINSATASNE